MNIIYFVCFTIMDTFNVHILVLLLLLVPSSQGLLLNLNHSHAQLLRRAAPAYRLQTKCYEPKMSPGCLSKTPQEQDKKYQFDSLDIVLSRARKRNRIRLLVGQLQSSIVGRRLLPFLSVGDALIVLSAFIILDAKGFAIGFVVGKATLASLRKLLREQDVSELLLNLVDFYPVALAAALDQII
jgi:hypothetical protein